MSSNLSLMNLFQTGAQRGNSKSKLNPKLAKYVYTVKDQICFWDLVKVKQNIDKAVELMNKNGSKKRQILLVGTSHHVKGLVETMSKDFLNEEMPFVCNRWIGGTLTNRKTINISVNGIKKIESYEQNEKFYKNLTSNEKLNLKKTKDRSTRLFGGIRTLKSAKPGCVLIFDGADNSAAMKEAEILDIPLIVITNASTIYLPNKNTIIIPCNNNSIKTVELIAKELITGYNEGLKNFVEEIKAERKPEQSAPRSRNFNNSNSDSRNNPSSGNPRNDGNQRTNSSSNQNANSQRPARTFNKPA